MNKHTYIKVSKINLFYASIVFPFVQIFLIFTIINKGSLFFIHRLSQNIFAHILNIKDMYISDVPWIYWQWKKHSVLVSAVQKIVVVGDDMMYYQTLYLKNRHCLAGLDCYHLLLIQNGQSLPFCQEHHLPWQALQVMEVDENLMNCKSKSEILLNSGIFKLV